MELTLTDRVYICTRCGMRKNQHPNAAINLNPVHTDPHFLIHDNELFGRFLRYVGIHPDVDFEDVLLHKLCQVFSVMPYENLTKIIKSDAEISASRAKRLPDEVIREYLHYGTGGTCFSLTATFIAILNAFGFETYPILADRRYGVDTHCALVFLQKTEFFLLDPGYLIYQPTRLPTTEPVSFSTGFNMIELQPHEAGRKVDLVTIINNDRRFRLTYKVNPVDGPTFGRAWERSFAWEMMTYPVLSRNQNGTHQYLQGHLLRTRNREGCVKHILSPDEQHEFISAALGIHAHIIKKAFSVIS